MAKKHTGQCACGAVKFHRPECGARVFADMLESFPGMVFVTLASLDDPRGIDPMLEMSTKRRLPWVKALDLPQFGNMPQ